MHKNMQQLLKHVWRNAPDYYQESYLPGTYIFDLWMKRNFDV